MGVSEGGGNTESTQRGMLLERGVISRDMQGSASWPQVLIFSKGIASWYWLVSLLGKWTVGFYIASPILRRNSFGLQNMEMNQYDSIFDVMKDVLEGLWYAGLSLLQVACVFVVESATCLVTESVDIYIYRYIYIHIYWE